MILLQTYITSLIAKTRVGVIAIVIVINLITFSKVIARNCNSDIFLIQKLKVMDINVKMGVINNYFQLLFNYFSDKL